MHGISRYRLVITPLFFSSAIPESVHIADSQSFLFTLVNPPGTEPMKVVLKPGASGGIRYRVDWGPRFGSKVSSDLLVWPTDNYGVVNLSLGSGFTCPDTRKGDTFFTGKSSSNINELEVFKICLF